MIVKVCGMRLASNIREAETSGADWMGFIFYERSPRFVGTLPEYLPQHLQRVGVFVNSDYSYIINKVCQFRLDYVQLHGQESPELIKELQDHVKRVTAPYKYPRVIEFVEELPKTISGKIRRVEIRDKDK